MAAQSRPAEAAKFTTGSTMRHVVVMTATGSIGLVAIFVVDALNLLYISMLGVHELTAAIGFASALLFFTISVAIGFTVACSALVSRWLGRGDRAEAARMGGASMVFMGLSTGAITLVAWPFLRQLTWLLGARGETLELTTRFLQIVMPSLPLMALGMCTAAILRGVGDARRAMYVTLGGGIAAAILDPLFIFGFGLGLDGAAISTVLARAVLVLIGLHGAHVVHRLITLPDRQRLAAALRPFFAIGLPAALTQLATPVGSAYVTVEIAAFGDQAVAGWAIVGRLVGVAFGVVFALSGAVGPIIGQNLGAHRHERIVSAVRDSLTFTVLYVLALWALLAIFAVPIADLFGAEGTARDITIFFCRFAAGSFLFTGAIFVASAACNNLGYPTYSTMFNWGRSTLGIIPFVWLGAKLYGAEGVVAGWGLGAVIFGIAAVIVCFRVIDRIALEAPTPKLPFSPLEGEMSGRTEGGAVPPT